MQKLVRDQALANTVFR